MDEETKKHDELTPEQVAALAWYKEKEAKKAAECVQKQNLVDGAYYEGRCRNAELARWFAKENRFTYWREKFGATFLEDINHPADDNGFDLFYPKAKVDEPTDEKKKIPWTAIEQYKKAHPDK